MPVRSGAFWKKSTVRGMSPPSGSSLSLFVKRMTVPRSRTVTFTTSSRVRHPISRTRRGRCSRASSGCRPPVSFPRGSLLRRGTASVGGPGLSFLLLAAGRAGGDREGPPDGQGGKRRRGRVVYGAARSHPPRGSDGAGRCPRPRGRSDSMARKHVRVIARKLVLRLPDLPQPWDVEELCRALERSRGRSLTLHPADIPAMPSGFWYDDGESDHIFYGSSVSGYYRDHIILHEICHMLMRPRSGTS